jgi:hypothetical protein
MIGMQYDHIAGPAASKQRCMLSGEMSVRTVRSMVVRSVVGAQVGYWLCVCYDRAIASAQVRVGRTESWRHQRPWAGVRKQQAHARSVVPLFGGRTAVWQRATS